MKHILVPTDFSASADNALDVAVNLAAESKAEIILMNSYETTGSAITDYMGVNREYDRQIIEETTTKLNEIKTRVVGTRNVSISTAVYTEAINESINNIIGDKNIDLVVMGTTGASGLKEKIWGSNTASVTQKSKKPVLVIPEEYKWSAPKKILFATNRFEDTDDILQPLFDFVHLFKAQTLAAVFSNEDTDIAGTVMEHSRNIHQFEQKLKTKFGETLTAEHLSGDSFIQTLEDYITENQIDIVAMVSHHRSFLDSIFHSSATKKMAYHTQIPLLVIPEKQTT